MLYFSRTDKKNGQANFRAIPVLYKIRIMLLFVNAYLHNEIYINTRD